jgi:hypothetical protein
MRRERVQRVLRTRRVEPASRRQVPADQPPTADRKHHHPGRHRAARTAHRADSPVWRTSSATAASSAVNAVAPASRSAPKRYRPPATSSPSTCATAARRRRRVRLRATAEPAHFPTAYETRAGTAASPWTNRSVTGPTLRRRARARASKLARSRMRQIRRRDASGRGPGEREGPLAPRVSASGRGSRESCCACDCWAGRCASNERPPRGGRARSRWGFRAGGDERFSVEAAGFQAQCGDGSSGSHRRGPL